MDFGTSLPFMTANFSNVGLFTWMADRDGTCSLSSGVADSTIPLLCHLQLHCSFILHAQASFRALRFTGSIEDKVIVFAVLFIAWKTSFLEEKR